MTHRRNTASFGFGQLAFCGAKEGKMSTNPKNVDCPSCKARIAELRAEAQKKAVR